MSRIIDFRAVIPWAEFFKAGQPDLSNWPDQAQGYERVMGIGDETLNLTVNDLLAAMDGAGVDLAIVQAEYVFGDVRLLNQAVANVVAINPNRFIGFGTANPREGAQKALRDFSYAVEELGLRGLNIQQWVHELEPDDRRYYPLYAKCLELGLPVTIHTGVNYSLGHSFRFGHPLTLDTIACDFPDLVIVANHSAWPWVTEMIAVARKHPNVYLELGGLAPKYLTQSDTGWGPFFRYANSLLQDRVLFASDWPAMDPRRSVAEVNEWQLKPGIREKILYKNAARLIGLDKDPRFSG